MFKYKDAAFYTSYFENQQRFKVIEDFKISEEQEEKNLYVGIVEVVGTVHPLVLRVEIPTAFPHMKLTFRTKSISGYPHLIHTGKIQYGDWFCLNTPFAETAEEQLEQEILRLNEWIEHQMRPELPAIIKDKYFIEGLRFANAYDFENLDEMNEFSSDATLTFMGDFPKKPDYFKSNKGFFDCVKAPNDRFFVFPKSIFTSFAKNELPFIIVDEAPKTNETNFDFFSLKKQYGWDEEICQHLLPRFGLNQRWIPSNKEYHGNYSLDDALKNLEQIKEELSKDECYLPAHVGCGDQTTTIPTKVHPQQKELILKELKRLDTIVKKINGFNYLDAWKCQVEEFDTLSEEEKNEILKEEQEEDFPFKYHFFALGFPKQDKIDWIVYRTFLNAGEFDIKTFNLKLEDYSLRKLISLPLKPQIPQTIDTHMYYGRGMFSENLIQKRIALIGLGAIGSIVADSLARSGASFIGLWDNDIVEPGNICRSTYLPSDLGNSKAWSLAQKILSINPFAKIDDIKAHGYWKLCVNEVNFHSFVNGALYDNINYDNQEECIKMIEDYDLIIDCTGSNELLHFLSYAASQKDIVSLCITNHANELVCVTSRDGNPFELRKAYLSRIQQDTKNFYLEGSGCYSPTFLATNSDISSLVNLALRELNQNMERGLLLHSTIWSHDKRGVIADRLQTYKLEGYDIRMTISSETMYDGEDMENVSDGHLGYILGSYSKDGQMIMVTHFVDAINAEHLLNEAFETSKGIIDYIGDFEFSDPETDTYKLESLKQVSCKASDDSINTCNPLLAIRKTDGTISFFLYINRKLVEFKKED